MAALPNLRVIIALGKIAHDSLIRMEGLRLADHPFGHGQVHQLPRDRILIDSYHCSRYNMNSEYEYEAIPSPKNIADNR